LENEYQKYLELSKISNRHFKPLLDPGGVFASETAAWWFQKRNFEYRPACHEAHGFISNITVSYVAHVA
jgi:hypothetical protein